MGPQHTLHHLMEDRNLTQKDPWKVLGSKGMASEVLHGKRPSAKLRQEMAAFFHVSADLFTYRLPEAHGTWQALTG
jgi:antitoxin component HigA of HigAB toxin-antitoxin module